jgi:hypothetical protein
MNVMQFNGPNGTVALTRKQVEALRSNGILPTSDGVEQPGIPDFTDEEVAMIIEDGGSPQRAMALRRYH